MTPHNQAFPIVHEPLSNVPKLREMLRELILEGGPSNLPEEDQEQCKEMIRSYFLEKRSR